MIRFLSVLVLMILLATPLAAKSFVCVSDSGSGFIFSESQKKWLPVKLNSSENRNSHASRRNPIYRLEGFGP
jgi:hypothetical protein